MNKTELLKLIDSVGDVPSRYSDSNLVWDLNLEGVSVGKNTFEYVDKGWSKAKEMKPAHLFK